MPEQPQYPDPEQIEKLRAGGYSLVTTSSGIKALLGSSMFDWRVALAAVERREAL